jgi:hypothetical protein
LSLVSAVCCQVEVFATGRSLVQRSPTDCGVSECEREASIMRRPWPAGGCWATGGGGEKWPKALLSVIKRTVPSAVVYGVGTEQQLCHIDRVQPLRFIAHKTYHQSVLCTRSD